MKIIKSFFFFGICLLLSSCAYLTRKSCEKVNWFERGEALALDGKYPQNDSQLKECRKAEADIDEAQLDLGFKRGRELYCQPERAFTTGKEGKLFATDICNQGGSTRHLLESHAKGVRAYCTPESGKALGASGAPFNAICPADLETSFKSAYQKARKSHLEGLIPGIQMQINQKQMELSRAQTELSFMQGQKSDQQSNHTLCFNRS